MKPLVVIPLVLVASAGAGAVSATLVRQPAAHAQVAPRSDTRELVQAVSALSERIDTLARENEALRLEVDARRASAERAPAEDLESAVARVLERRAAEDDAAPDDLTRTPELADESDFDLQATFDQLLAAELGEMEAQELWARVAKSGQLDDLVAMFEERAQRNPDDPDIQVDLGGAYLQKVFESGSGPMAGKWAMKADGSFDDALALDDRHWDARFSKATSLSFWPPALGKQGEAIKHFETLVAQQDQIAPEPRHASTYLMLGNTYQQIGDSQKALATWTKGSQLFPDDPALAAQIANATGN